MNDTLYSNLNNNRHGNFFLIAGPCVIEDEEMPMAIARHIKKITDRLEIPFIFKASYQKANRSRSDSFTGIGHEKALKLISQLGKELSIPVLTDIHTEQQAPMAAEFADLLQIPAFLCRQTELLIAAGNTGKIVNIKKGQFASAESMKFAVQKVKQTGNSQIILTERGTTFGYNDLIVDFRNIPEMQAHGVPVVVDVTHSLQQPNQSSGITGGRPDLIEAIAKAAIAVGSDGIFIETHPDPGNAKSDGANMLHLSLLEDLLEKLVKIRKALY
ncbi:MAG: 3-deoxy-8-phosphooctulonate synthase [Bacteroidales bacterium]|nr:3-deoxy-8-phosphooctulonate synthase [Bacteroidales bacterium]